MAGPPTSLQRSALLLQCLSRPGPSRLASRSQPCSHCLRHASTTSTSSTSDVNPHSSFPDVDPVPTNVNSRGKDRDSTPQVNGYTQWFATVAQKFRYPPENGPNWISGRLDYPYPSNPSFRPPPPLSDSLKERIYQDHFHPSTLLTPTIPQLAAKYAISKSRIGAILKLKAVEKGWVKEGKILQTPFQEKMERYLGSRSGGYDQNRWSPTNDIELRRQQPSYLSELAEETAHQEYLSSNPSGDDLSKRSPHDAKGGMDMSAFSKRDTVESDNGIERGIWEFRDENQTPSTTMPGGSAELDVPYNRVFSDDAMDAFEEREEKRAQGVKVAKGKAWEGKDRLQSTYQANPRSVVYRFVDTKPTSSSSTTGPATMSTKGLGTKQARGGKPSSDRRKALRAEGKRRRLEVALERIRLADGAKK